jgi:hypothetical protein
MEHSSSTSSTDSVDPDVVVAGAAGRRRPCGDGRWCPRPFPRNWDAGPVQWSPRTGETAALGAVGLGLALAAVAVDAAGRLLVGAAALLFLALAARDALLRPRLTADELGVVVRRLGGRTRLPWRQLQVAVRTTRRLGLTSRSLELDTAAGPDDAGVLVLLGRRELGADPEEVAGQLRRLAPT